MLAPSWGTRHWIVFRGTKRRFVAVPRLLQNASTSGVREREKEGVINKNITIKIELYSRPGIHESWRKRAACRSIQHVSSVSELTREFATTRWSFHHCDLLPSQFSPSLFFAVLIVSHHYQLNNRLFALHIFLHYLNHMQLVVKERLELELAKKIVIQSDHFAVYIILFAFLITARHQHIQ